MNGDVLFAQIFDRRNCPADPTKNFRFGVYLSTIFHQYLNQSDCFDEKKPIKQSKLILWLVKIFVENQNSEFVVGSGEAYL